MRSSQRGFSLLEVLVAFSILALALGVLMQAFATGLRNTALADEYSQALLHAESVLARVGSEIGLEQTDALGEELDDTYSWRGSIEEYVEDEDSDDQHRQVVLYTVTVEVFWDSAGKPRSLALQTLRLAQEGAFRGRQ